MAEKRQLRLQELHILVPKLLINHLTSSGYEFFEPELQSDIASSFENTTNPDGSMTSVITSNIGKPNLVPTENILSGQYFSSDDEHYEELLAQTSDQAYIVRFVRRKAHRDHSPNFYLFVMLVSRVPLLRPERDFEQAWRSEIDFRLPDISRLRIDAVDGVGEYLSEGLLVTTNGDSLSLYLGDDDIILQKFVENLEPLMATAG